MTRSVSAGRAWLMSRMGHWLLVLALLFEGVLGAALIADAQTRSPDRTALDEQLTTAGEKVYELNSGVPALAMRSVREEGTGEGLPSRLFSDPIAVLELALERNERNTRARFLLAKCYFAKSSRGEGKWTRSLLTKAEEEFSRVVTESRGSRLSTKQLAEARRAMEDIRKIREGQGELLD